MIMLAMLACGVGLVVWSALAYAVDALNRKEAERATRPRQRLNSHIGIR